MVQTSPYGLVGFWRLRDTCAPAQKREPIVDIDDNPLRLLVSNLEAHSVLGREDRQAVLDLPYKLRTLEPATYIVREGDPPIRCALIVSGLAFRQKSTNDGARQIIALQFRGEAGDFQNLFLDVS